MRPLLVLLLVVACSTPPEVVVPTEAPALRGRLVVVGAAGGTTPIAGRISFPGTPIEGRAGPDGRFGFAHVPAATLRLAASSGTRALLREVVVGTSDVDLGDVVLEATGGVSGHVTRDGAPVAGASVVAQGVASTTSAGDGSFVLDGLAAGTYELVAVHGGAGARAADIVVKAGERTQAALALAPGLGTLQGHAQVVASGSSAGIAITLTGGASTVPAAATTDSGDFEVADVPGGVYGLLAQRAGFQPVSLEHVGAVPGATLPVPILLISKDDPFACAPPSDCSPDTDAPDAGTVSDAPDAGTTTTGCAPACGGATPKCGDDGACHECLVDADCAGSATCDPAAKTCVASWRELGDLPDRRNAFPFGFDPVRKQLLVGGGTGGMLTHDDLWGFALDGGWKRLAGGGLDAVFFTFTCSDCGFYDAANERFVVIGQTTGLGGGFGVWAAPVAASGVYAQLAIDGDGPTQPPVAAIYDAKHARGIYVGVRYDVSSQALVQAVYALNLPKGGTPTWTLLTPTGAPPTRKDASAVYDPDGQRLLLSAGRLQANGTAVAETWALSLPDEPATPAWTLLDASPGPGPRTYHVAAYDSLHKALVIYGGDANQASWLDDAWALDLTPAATGWTRLAAMGPNPGGRANAGGIFDGQRLLVFGGHIQGIGDLNDVWQLDLANGFAAAQWARVTPSVFGLADSAVTWDPVRARLLAFGGAELATGYRDEVLALPPGGGWTTLATSGTRPSPRMRAGAVHDGTRAILFGGRNDGGFLNDTWSLDSTTGAWALVHDGTGTAPAGRMFHALVYDPDHAQLVVFGGDVEDAYGDDMWTLPLASSGPAWTRLGVTGPTARQKSLAAYDPLGKRIVVVGGEDDSGPLADVWVLTIPPGNAGAAWTPMTPSGGPPVQPVAMAYDAARHRFLVYDAQGSTPDGADFAAYALWALDVGAAEPAWEQLCPGPGALPPAIGAGAYSEPTGAAMLPGGFTLFGWMGGGGVAGVWTVGAGLGRCP